MHSYLWGILISAFIADILKNKIQPNKNIESDLYKEEDNDNLHYNNKPHKDIGGIKVKDGNEELQVTLDKPNYSKNDYEIIPLSIQYW